MHILLCHSAIFCSGKNRITVVFPDNYGNVSILCNQFTEAAVIFLLLLPKLNHSGGDDYSFSRCHIAENLKSHAGAVRIAVEGIIYDGDS